MSYTKSWKNALHTLDKCNRKFLLVVHDLDGVHVQSNCDYRDGLINISAILQTMIGNSGEDRDLLMEDLKVVFKNIMTIFDWKETDD